MSMHQCTVIFVSCLSGQIETDIQKKKGLDKKRCFCQNGRTFFGEGVAGLQCKTSIHFVSSLPDGLRDSSGLMQRGSTGLARQKSERVLWRRPRLQSFIAQREAEACAETWQKQCDKQMTEQGKSPLRSPKHTWSCSSPRVSIVAQQRTEWKLSP